MGSEEKLELLGYSGAVLLILAYALLSFKILNNDSLIYQGMNVAAAFIYGFYAVKKPAKPVLVVQIFWGVIGIVAIIKILFA